MPLRLPHRLKEPTHSQRNSSCRNHRQCPSPTQRHLLPPRHRLSRRPHDFPFLTEWDAMPPAQMDAPSPAHRDFPSPAELGRSHLAVHSTTFLTQKPRSLARPCSPRPCRAVEWARK